MKLVALELEQFRKFDRCVRVTGFGDGLNLLVGPNEMGKSTLFAALQAVLFERHRSQAQTVRSFQPAGHEGAAPRVALEFTERGERYRIEKRFLRRPSAELLLPDGRRLHGEPAEEALERLLGGGVAGGTAPQGIRGLLWVGQGHSFAPPDLGGAERGTLQAALDLELGEVLAGDHGSALLNSVGQALQELVYKSGAPRGRYKEADEARQAAQREAAELVARRAELERDLDDLESVGAELERLRAEERATEAEAELAGLSAERDRLKLQHAELREAEAALQATRHEQAQTAAELARREELRRAQAVAEAEHTVACAEAAEAAEAAASAEREAAGQQAKVERLQATLDQAESQRRGLQRLAEAIRQRDDGRAALQAAASEVELELEADALERVRVGGRPPGEPRRSLRIVDPLEITIAGIGRIRVRPVIADRRRLQGSIKDAERRIGREVEVLGLGPPDARTRQLELALAAEAPLARRTGGPDAAADEAPAWPEAAAVETARGESERQIDALAAQLRPARRQRDALVDAHHRVAAAHGQATARQAHAERRLAQVQAELAGAELATEEAMLLERGAALQRALAIAEHRVQQLREQSPAQSLAELEERIAGLRAAQEHRAGLVRERELALERTRERVQLLAGGGLDERLAGARRRAEALERECAGHRREVEALELLLRVLQEAEREAKERYALPVLDRLRPYLAALFPGADVTLDEGLRIVAVARGGASEPIERLSDGTREQIAVLTRLAFAELLADQGLAATVVLDDALVFSDDRRIEQMFAILTQAAARLQIVLLTCRERLFGGLAAQRLRLDEPPVAAAS
jgi:energy-coupling factor transporter ATP-binding protein EcfA2